MNFINKCSVCNVKEDIKPLLTEAEVKSLLNDIYRGKINKKNLPVKVYLQIAKEINDKLYAGYGATEPTPLLKPFTENIYYFSAAKTYQMVSECQEMRSNGKVMVSEKTFIDKVGDTVTDFLGAYLFAEADHSQQVGVVTNKWNKAVNRKTVPYLEYVTMKDNRVRPEHILLDGIIRKADDAFWNTFYPPNGWMCRCKTNATAKGEETNLEAFDESEALQNVPPAFRYNFAKEEIVFPKDHPYFKVPNADKLFARKNFHLPIPNVN